MKHVIRLLAYAASSFLIAPVFAHHSVVTFDMAVSSEKTISGEVLQYEWKNPHVYIRVLAPDDNGEMVEWAVEGQGISNLLPRGLTVNSIKEGDVVTLIGNPNRVPSKHLMNGVAVTLENGTTIALGSVVPPHIVALTDLDPDVGSAASDLKGVWLTQNEYYFQTFQTEDWQLTDEAEARKDEFDGSQIPQAECIPVPPPRLTLWPVVHEIEIEEDIVRIRSDWMGAERTVYLNPREHPAPEERSVLGHSVGRWDNDTLVVYTTNYSEAAAGISWGIPSGEQKHTIERFSLVEDGTQLRYEFILEDSEYLEEPYSGMAMLRYRPDLEPSGVECDPEVSSRFLYE